MVQGYYTLEESAKILGMSADDLKQLARKGEIRSFQDRGTWRFRIQDIQEMARRRGDGSDLELAGGASAGFQPADPPAPRSPKPQAKEEDVFTFSLAPEEGEQRVNPDADIHLDKEHGSSGGKKSSSKRLPQPGTDSDVRLVGEGSDISFKMPAGDSDVKLSDGSEPKSGPRSSKTGLAGPKSSKPAKAGESVPEPLDSGVRLVALDSDSDVRIVGADADDARVPLGEQPPKGATDSDIRLEGHMPAGRGTGLEGGHLTEEINLDEELKKEEARHQKRATQAKPRAPQPEFPKKSPFELSQSDLNLSPLEDQQAQLSDSSSDFDLTPANESSSPLELSSSEEFSLNIPEEGFALVEDHKTNLQGPQSGINLGDPADSGISLEQSSQSSSENEFELTLDAESTPKPASPKSSKKAAAKLVEPEEDSDSSEFELSLDVDSNASTSDSDSEFELTLDDSGGLAPIEEAAADGDQEKDIFETDFEVPALDEDSASGGVVVEEGDTDLESSDFELAIGDEDAVAEDASGSEVVALDEEEIVAEEEPAPRKGKKKKAAAVLEEAGEIEALQDGEADDEVILDEEEDGQLVGAAVQQAPWGIFPVAVLIPCVIVMMFLGMLGIELVQTQHGYKPGLLTKAIGGLIDGKK